MPGENCIICQSPKIHAHCGICKNALCKDCEEYLEPGSFSFLEKTPEELDLAHYCPSCFDSTITPARTKYEETLALAREVNIFFSADKHLPRILEKAKKPIHVENCKDRDETILRLGFKAAELGFNSIIKVEVTAAQIRNLAFQTSRWQGTGIPVNIDLAKYNPDR